MPKIAIRKTEYSYDETDVIVFDEGLIGLPEVRRTVLVKLPDYQPFSWLIALDNPETRFLVVNPLEIFASYESYIPAEITTLLRSNSQPPGILAIVKISSDWTKTTINLRAPIFVNFETRRAAQAVLTGTNYRLDEKLPEV